MGLGRVLLDCIAIESLKCIPNPNISTNMPHIKYVPKTKETAGMDADVVSALVMNRRCITVKIPIGQIGFEARDASYKIAVRANVDVHQPKRY